MKFSGKILYDFNSDEKLQPASLAKNLTFLVVMREVKIK